MLSFFFSFFFPFYITYCLISSILSLLFLHPHFLLLSLTHISIFLTHTPDLIISSTIKGKKKTEKKKKKQTKKERSYQHIIYIRSKRGFFLLSCVHHQNPTDQSIPSVKSNQTETPTKLERVKRKRERERERETQKRKNRD